MQYRKRRFGQNIDHKQRAIDVLYRKMQYYNDDAMMIATEICKVLKDSPTSEGKRLVEMHKMMMRFDDISIDCASKLAPYQSAKLQSLEINKKVTHRFVIQAPMVVKDNKEWLEQVSLTALPPPLHVPKPIEEKIDTIDEEDYEWSALNVS